VRVKSVEEGEMRREGSVWGRRGSEGHREKQMGKLSAVKGGESVWRRS
jgi:hypothetical protein